MRTLAITRENDVVVSKGQMLLHKDLLAVQDVCVGAMQGVRGEMVLNQNAGIPYFDLVFCDKPNLAVFEAEARASLLAVANVLEVKTFTVSKIGNEINYAADIVSSFGETALRNV